MPKIINSSLLPTTIATSQTSSPSKRSGRLLVDGIANVDGQVSLVLVLAAVVIAADAAADKQLVVMNHRGIPPSFSPY
ncbi:hypothetical protein Tdes44962_MAKER07232 [Teratosphaeria destructans]|uniref:Uncharacterized protein n=1 Tax=Teratosphaeria destructans TaxID=418781 RepID=A0A9W7T0A0_9PEZI|nr:hypothetical protein Tdes44962_MAKER07232 [Teratosphaeria destructans]